jgi:cysteine-S-conjugate beta-lyase
MPDSRFDFDTFVDRSNSDSEKWSKYQGRDIIPLWVADMDFRSPPAVIEALHERVGHGIFGYTHPPRELVEVVTNHLQSDFTWRIEEEWIVWLPGLVCGLNVLCRAIGDEGDEVITFTPVYPPSCRLRYLSRRSLVKVPLQLLDGRWKADMDALERAITPRTKMLMLCNPHNPVGRAWSRQELTQFAEVAARHDLVIGSDEIHAGLILDEEKSPHTHRDLVAGNGPPHHHPAGPQQDFQYPRSRLFLRHHPRPGAASRSPQDHGRNRAARQRPWLCCRPGGLPRW